jgi:aspartyl-tRNA(Asn)/glutamyl-tRNA(Gln) amidotransferase subunit A
MTNLAFEPMHVVAERIRERELSPVEATEAALREVERRGEELNPFITLTADLALAMARDAEAEIAAGRYRGPLQGIPVVLKDLLDTAGVRTTAGSRILAENVPVQDATVTRKLREAGAVFIGKTGMPEFALFPTSTNPFYGPVRNPWDTSRDTGGSSSGTGAAIAAGMAWCGPGSDTGGSIRIPASACGLVGLKPTWGRVSLKGVWPLCASHDHVGPMARNVRDTALLLAALAGYDPDDPYSRAAPVDNYLGGLEEGVAGLRVGVLVDDGGPEPDEEIVRHTLKGVATLAASGAIPTDLRVPDLDPQLRKVLDPLEAAQYAADYREWLETRPDDFSQANREFGLAGLALDGPTVHSAWREMNNILHRVELAARDVDIIVSPTLSVFVPPAGETHGELCRYTQVWDVNGWPSISVPVGLSAAGLPIGLQISARPWEEALVLRAARAIEREHGLTWPAG